uniref:Peptidase M28 domain-containing protein n=2 Tax=Eptatretus burgeri TaxID=7764 RepID=A0A8C4QF73_EPTBU
MTAVVGVTVMADKSNVRHWGDRLRCGDDRLATSPGDKADDEEEEEEEDEEEDEDHQIGRHRGVVRDDETSNSVLEWDLEKELSETRLCGRRHCDAPSPGLARFATGFSDSLDDLELENYSVSPHGRFQRLRSDGDSNQNTVDGFMFHSTDKLQQSSRRRSSPSCCRHPLIPALLFATLAFFLGLAFGYLSQPSKSNSANSGAACEGVWDVRSDSEMASLRAGVLENLTEDAVVAAARGQLLGSELERVQWLRLQWERAGLQDVKITEHPRFRIKRRRVKFWVLKQEREKASEWSCFLNSGESCSPDEHGNASSRDLPNPAEVINVWYGRDSDLNMSRIVNMTGRIVLLKTGYAPLLLKLRILAKLGAHWALVYTDPSCPPASDGVFLGSGKHVQHITEEDDLCQNTAPLPFEYISTELAWRLYPRDPHQSCKKPSTFLSPPLVHIEVTNLQNDESSYTITGCLPAAQEPDRFVLLAGSHGDVPSDAVVMATLALAVSAARRSGWRPRRSLLFCSWGLAGPESWIEAHASLLGGNAVAYVGIGTLTGPQGSLLTRASPSLQQLAADSLAEVDAATTFRNSSVLPLPPHAFLLENLGLATITFFLPLPRPSPATRSENMSPAAGLPSTTTLTPAPAQLARLAKVAAYATLRLADDPVLPFRVVDLALMVQNYVNDLKMQAPQMNASTMHTIAQLLRSTAEDLQSDMNRPANDPAERPLFRLRMLNDALQRLSRSFIASHLPVGLSRNILMRPAGVRHGTFPPLQALLDVGEGNLLRNRHRSSNESTASFVLIRIFYALEAAEVATRAAVDIFKNEK